MTISNSIPADAVLVAIDIAKVRNEVLIDAPGDKRRRRLQILNNRVEYDRLISSLARARTREALHNSWDKSDPKDAQVMPHMPKIQATQRYRDPLRAGINDVQELSKTHEAIAKAKTEIPAPHPDALPAAVISRDRSLPGRLVLRVPRCLSDTGERHGRLRRTSSSNQLGISSAPKSARHRFSWMRAAVQKSATILSLSANHRTVSSGWVVLTRARP